MAAKTKVIQLELVTCGTMPVDSYGNYANTRARSVSEWLVFACALEKSAKPTVENEYI